MQTIRSHLFSSDIKAQWKTLYCAKVYQYLTFGIKSWGWGQLVGTEFVNWNGYKTVWSDALNPLVFLTPTSPILKRLHIFKLTELHVTCKLHVLKQMYLYSNNLVPPSIDKFLTYNVLLTRIASLSYKA